MAKLYVKLKDTGTSFWDPSQRAGVVSDRIGEFGRTAKVHEAIKKGVLILLEDQEQAAEDFIAQQKELGKWKDAETTETKGEKAEAAIETEVEKTEVKKGGKASGKGKGNSLSDV